jgi:membrane fusion protein, multidrug efflux system
MPTLDLTRRARRQLGRRRNVLLIVTTLVAGVVVLAVVTRGDGAADGGGFGPTAVVEPRDLATTLEASGSLQRSDEHTVAHAAPLPSNGGDTPSDGGEAPADGQGDDTDGDDMDGGGAQPASFVTPSTAGSSTTGTTSSTTRTTTPTSGPCAPTSTSSTSTSSSTTSTTPCPTTTSTTSTTTPTTSTTMPTSSTTTPTTMPTTSTTTPPSSTTTPASSTTPSTPPRSDGGGTSSPSAGGPGGAGGSGGNGGGGGSGGGEVPSATLTGMLDVGATADRGTVLYSADEEPVVAMIGDLPAWRTLEHGVDDGADVRQLEENLAAMGYGDDLEVDESFTADTARAVEAWETDLGRATPDGVVTIGEVVFLTERGDVLGHDASVGDTLEAGSPVMTIGSEQRIVVADVDATEAGGWTSGSRVELEWADGTTSRGTVAGTGREVTDGEVELTVAIGGDDAGAGRRRSGAEATVSLVDARRDGVLAVPVAAIVDDDGSPAVRVAQADGADHTVAVQTGLVADGWIEITGGLDGGEEVRLPG